MERLRSAEAAAVVGAVVVDVKAVLDVGVVEADKGDQLEGEKEVAIEDVQHGWQVGGVGASLGLMGEE